MKIWYISKYAFPPIDGNYTRHFLLSKEFVRQGNEVTLIYSRSNGKKSKRHWGLKKENNFEGVRCVSINGPLIKFGFNVKRIFSWLLFEINLLFVTFFTSKKNKPDVIIVSSLSILTFLSGVILKRRFKCKMIIEVRDIWPDTLLESGRFLKKNIFIRFLYWVEAIGYRHSDAFIATMPKFDEYLKTKSYKPFRFLCIPQGFDAQYINMDIRVKNDAFRDDCFNVCYAGSIGAFNYVNEFLEAAKLLECHSHIHFVIIGDGPLKKEYEEEYGELQNVSFSPAVSRVEIVGHLLNADLLVNLWGDKKIYQYGVSPNKWIDYMLSGHPVLVTYNGFRSIINEAECGFFIEANKPELLAETIESIAQMGKKDLNEMGRRGKEFALNNLDYSMLGSKFLNFIHSL